jgi:hypothetical protein
MRPVVMTCVVAGVGLLPAAFSQGVGSQVQKPSVSASPPQASRPPTRPRGAPAPADGGRTAGSGPTQMRPVVMTCVVAGVGLLPAAFSQGVGSQVQKPGADRAGPLRQCIAAAGIAAPDSAERCACAGRRRE